MTGVRVDLDVMSEEQRKAMQTQLRGGRAEPVIPFAQPTSLTRVYAMVSGKGGVGKSSVTVNLAVALAASGYKVGLVDADIYGHSVPRMLGVTGLPTKVEKMIMPPSAHGVKVISMGMFKPPGNLPIVWRGPMLARPCSSSWPTCTGATLTTCCSTCRRGRVTWRSRSRSCCRRPSSWW